MQVTTPKELLEADVWALAEGKTALGTCLVRYREPILAPEQTTGYSTCVRVFFSYAAEGSGALPNPDMCDTLALVEDELAACLEKEAMAVLTAVITFDGARQWIFYTGSPATCEAHLSRIAGKQKPGVIEIETFADGGWTHLREQVLGGMKSERVDGRGY